MVDYMAEQKGRLKGESKEFIEAFLESIKEKLLEDPDNEIVFNNFGKFTLTWHGERVAGSIDDQEERVIPGHYRMHFTPSKKFKEKINEEYPNELDE